MDDTRVPKDRESAPGHVGQRTGKMANSATIPPLVSEVLSRSTGKGSFLHGPAHWRAVAATALILLDRTPGADPLVALLFSLLHDSMRRGDGRDPEHGARAAELARGLRDEGAFSLDDERMDRLTLALELHDKGGVSEDPTVGVCWDGDRLQLPRVLRRPDPRLLSTPAARRLAVGRGIWGYCQTAAAERWDALFLLFDAASGGGVSRALGDAFGEAPPSGEAVYLRFGPVPASGRSEVGMFGLSEAGVSAYPGRRAGDGYVVDLARLTRGMGAWFAYALLGQGRRLYVVEGALAGFGSTGEPLLEDARVVEEVAPEKLLGVSPDGPMRRAAVARWRRKLAAKGGPA